MFILQSEYIKHQLVLCFQSQWTQIELRKDNDSQIEEKLVCDWLQDL